MSESVNPPGAPKNGETNPRNQVGEKKQSKPKPFIKGRNKMYRTNPRASKSHRISKPSGSGDAKNEERTQAGQEETKNKNVENKPKNEQVPRNQ
jgi:hypothetical protein